MLLESQISGTSAGTVADVRFPRRDIVGKIRVQELRAPPRTSNSPKGILSSTRTLSELSRSMERDSCCSGPAGVTKLRQALSVNAAQITTTGNLFSRMKDTRVRVQRIGAG